MVQLNCEIHKHTQIHRAKKISDFIVTTNCTETNTSVTVEEF